MWDVHIRIGHQSNSKIKLRGIKMSIKDIIKLAIVITFIFNMIVKIYGYTDKKTNIESVPFIDKKYDISKDIRNRKLFRN